MAGLREQKKRLARDTLAKAALELFSEKGFEHTTVDEIAARAGISRRSFFRYFTSKEEAAFPKQNERLAQFRELLQRYDVKKNGVGAVREACIAIGRQYAAERPERLARQRLVDSSTALRNFEQAADVEMEQILVDELAGNVASNVPSSGSGAAASGDDDLERTRRARIFAAAVMGLVRVVLREWFDSEGQTDLEQLGRSAFTWLEHGFRFDTRQPSSPS